jgi:cytochrome c oxidase subunit I+III
MLANWPLTWRAVILTSTLDARPMEVFRVAGPSIWPFVAAVGMVMIFASEVFSQHIAALVGLVVIAVALVGWHWPSDVPTTVEEEERFEHETGIQVRPNGSPIIARWAMGSIVLVLAIAIGTLLFAYFYIRIENQNWPPPGIPLPNWPAAVVSMAVVLVGTALTWWAERSVKANALGRMKVGLALAFLLSVGAGAIVVLDLARLPFDWATHAYGSVFFALAGAMLMALAGGLLFSLLTQVWAWRGRFHARHYNTVSNAVVYFTGLAAMWLVVFAVLYGGPYLF